MQVNFNFLQQNNNFLNVNAVNRGLNKKDNTTIHPDKNRNKDRANISPRGKMMNAIEELMKRKETIIKQKSELVSKTLENGGDMKSIEVQLETFEEQLNNIDKQVSQITAQQMKEATEEEEKKKPQQSDENKTKEQIESEKLNKIASVAEDIKNAAIVSSAKNRVEGEARVEQTEINIAEIKIDELESEGIDGSVNVKEMIAHAKAAVKVKEKYVSDLEVKALLLDSSHGEKLKVAADKLEEAKEPVNEGEKSRELNVTDDSTPTRPSGKTMVSETTQDSNNSEKANVDKADTMDSSSSTAN